MSGAASDRTTGGPRLADSGPAGSVRSRRRASEGMPVAGAPGWHVIRRTAPVASGDPMRRPRRFRLAAGAVTATLVALLLVLSMVRAQRSEAPAGQTVVIPMPPLVISPGAGPAFGPTPAPKAPTEQRARPQDTVATSLQTRPDPVLPDELALLPPASIEASRRSTAELEIRPQPVGLSAAPLPSTIDGSPSRAQESRREPLQPGRSSPQVADDPGNLRAVAKLQVASEASTSDDHSAVAAASAAALPSTIEGSPPRAEESRIEPVQTDRSSTQVTDDSANLRAAAKIQVASQPTTAEDTPALPAGEIRVFIHHVADQRDGALAQRLADYLRGQGFTVADIRSVDFSIGKPSVRYFFARDRAASQRLVEELGRFSAGGASLGPDHASDFTHFVPKPRPGSVEVWLPGS